MIFTIRDNGEQMPIDPELVGLGEKRAVGATVYGTARHFEGPDGIHALCGVSLAINMDADEWVSCTRCMAAARRVEVAQ